MSTVYLVPDDPAFDAIGFDITRNEDHNGTTTVTANPVEDGSVVNDHMVHEPDAFACQVLVSNTPIRTTFYGDGDVRTVPVTTPQFEGRGIIVPSTLSVRGFTGTRTANLVKEMHDRLERLRTSGVLMTILTSTREYESMALVSVGIGRGEKTIGQGTFNLSFAKIKIVQTQEVRAPKPKEKRAFGGQAIGQDAPKPTSGNEVNESWLLQLSKKDPGEVVAAFQTTFGGG